MYNNKKILSSILVLLVTIIVIGASSYAFFDLVVNNDNHVTSDITTKKLSLKFSDGPKVELTDVLPGATIIKTFSVENTGTETLYYSIYLNDVTNSFTRTSDLVYTLTSTNDGGVMSETVLPQTSGLLAGNIAIPKDVTQNYTLTITYKNLDENQNADMGATFSGTLGIISGVKTYNLTGYAYDNNGDLMNSGTVEVHSDVITAPIQSDGSFTLVNVPVGDHEIIIKNNNNDILYQDDFKLEITTSTESINNNIIKADNETQTIKINCSNSGIEIKPLGNLYTVDLMVNNGYTTSPILTAYSGQKTNVVTISPEENYEYDSITCTNDITYTLNDNKLYVNELTTSGTCTINFISTKLPAVVGTVTFPASGTQHVSVGFKPAYIIISRGEGMTGVNMMVYSKDYSTTKFRYASDTGYSQDFDLNTTTNNRIYSIDEDGFTIRGGTLKDFQYIAIPENYDESVSIGEFTYSTSSQTHIDLGFKPKYLAVTKRSGDNSTLMQVYSEDYSTTKYRRADKDHYNTDKNIGTNDNIEIKSIDIDGFTVNKYSQAVTMQYIAVG